MAHLKRSDEFKQECELLADAIRNQPEQLSEAERVRISQILRANTTDTSCMMKAADDEPVFVIRGKDPVGGAAVWEWAQFAEDLGAHEALKIMDARVCATQMDEYKTKLSTPKDEVEDESTADSGRR